MSLAGATRSPNSNVAAAQFISNTPVVATRMVPLSLPSDRCIATPRKAAWNARLRGRQIGGPRLKVGRGHIPARVLCHQVANLDRHARGNGLGHYRIRVAISPAHRVGHRSILHKKRSWFERLDTPHSPHDQPDPGQPRPACPAPVFFNESPG